MSSDDDVITCTLTLDADGVLTVRRTPGCTNADVYAICTAIAAGDVAVVDLTPRACPAPGPADRGTPRR